MVFDNITLLGMDGGGSRPLITKAMQICKQQASFARCLLLSPHREYDLMDGIEHMTIPALTYPEWNVFVINELHKYIDTEYYLFVDTDGFILNPHLWMPEFLHYDYIGAPWPDYLVQSYASREGIIGKNNVGNGGFTMRSKKFLNVCKDITHDGHSPEDAFLCVKQFDYLTSQGLTFAPDSIAKIFSTEPYAGNSFGFHGNKDIIHRVQL